MKMTDSSNAEKFTLGGEPQVVSEPVYQQLARVCRERLTSGDAKPGTRFPSERELARDFNISRATASKVLSNLVAEGLLERRRGIGMFVSGTKTLHASLREMESFTKHALDLGLEPETQVLDFRTLAPGEIPPAVTEALALTEDEQIIFTERLRLAGGEPVILEFRWIRASLMPGLTRADLAGSFYALMETRYGLRLAGERSRIDARNCSREEATKLGVAKGAAALVVAGAGYTDTDEGIWYQILLYRGDRYHLENQVQLGGQNHSTQFKRKDEGFQ